MTHIFFGILPSERVDEGAEFRMDGGVEVGKTPGLSFVTDENVQEL